MLNFKTILVLSPHTDDGEFSCGASIAKFIEMGAEVHYVAFSAAEDSVPAGFPSDILRKEVFEATRELGIPPENVIVLGFSVRKFPQSRQDILEEMVKLNNSLNPDLVFMPASTDTHQDHKTVFEEGFRAFKKRAIFGYEVPWNNLDFRTCAFVTVEERHLVKKTRALTCYKSQAFRNYATEEFVRSLAITRGIQIGTRYAEAFEVIRYVVK